MTNYYTQKMDTLEYIIDYNSIAKKVASKKELLFSEIENDVKEAILRMSPSQTLSFRIYNNAGMSEKVPMAAEKRYAKVLWCFLRNKDYEKDGVVYHIESDVTVPILKQVEKTIVNFYSSSEVSNCIAVAISDAVSTSRIVQASIGSSVNEARNTIQKEITAKIANHSLTDVKSNIVNQVTDQVVSFMNTSMMQQIVNTVGTCVTAGAGKIIVSKIAIVLSKSISATALKTVVMSVVKKIGLTTIAKTAVGKAVAIALTTIGLSANAAFFVALIPVIAIILAHEYYSFPKKLSKKVPSQVVSDIRNHFDEMNNQIIQNMMSELSKQISLQQTKQTRSIKRGIIITVVCLLLSLLIWAACAICCSNHNNDYSFSSSTRDIVQAETQDALDYENEKSVENDYVENDNNESIDNDILETEPSEYQQKFYVGRVYRGGGNGGGLGTSLMIRFENDGKCLCTSDWYQAFDDMVSINGTYAVKDKLLIVKCHIDDSSGVEEGYDVIFNFEISNNGQTLSFDHSDPNEEGTIGNDYMSITEE